MLIIAFLAFPGNSSHKMCSRNLADIMVTMPRCIQISKVVAAIKVLKKSLNNLIQRVEEERVHCKRDW